MKGIIYPSEGPRARTVLLPARLDDDDDGTSGPWAEQVIVSRWFPSGHYYTRVSSIPATDFPLTNDYTIISTSSPNAFPRNKALRERLGLSMHGNIVVLKHSSRRPLVVTNVHWAEKRMIDLVVSRYVHVLHLNAFIHDSAPDSLDSVAQRLKISPSLPLSKVHVPYLH